MSAKRWIHQNIGRFPTYTVSTENL